MNDEILKNLQTNKDLLEVFTADELTTVYKIFNSDCSDTKKKDMIDLLIKEEKNENL